MSSEMPPGKKGRLVRISGHMLGAYCEDASGKIYAKKIETKSLICIDISTCDPYPDAPARVWHPQFGKMWYIDDGFSDYEWLDSEKNVDANFLILSDPHGGPTHSGR
tara:strand:- start:59 stop:379 length:321 start_codon:yes stop_codon:yes gene_type:complete